MEVQYLLQAVNDSLANLPDDLGKGAYFTTQATILSKSSEENCQEMTIYSDRVNSK